MDRLKKTVKPLRIVCVVDFEQALTEYMSEALPLVQIGMDCKTKQW
jgi:hypothetical protein